MWKKGFPEIFWAPIPFKRYRNTSGCGTEKIINFEHISHLFLGFRLFALSKYIEAIAYLLLYNLQDCIFK